MKIRLPSCAYPLLAAAVLIAPKSAAQCAEPEPEQVAAKAESSRQIADLLKDAAEAAREVADPGPAAYALLEIARAMVQAEDKVGAHSLVQEALKIFPRIKSIGNVGKASVAELAAGLLVRLGDLEGALQTAELLKDDEEQDSVRLEIVAELLTLHEFDQALDVCGRFVGQDARDEAYSAVAASLASAGKVEEARAVVKKIEGESERSSAMVAIVDARLGADDIEGAQRLAEKIEDAASRFAALAAVVEAQLDAKQDQAAKETFLKAQETAGLASVHEGLRLIELQAEVGQLREALAIADALGDQEVRDGVVHAIVLWLAGKGEIEEAQRLMKTIETEETRAPLVAAIALGQALSGAIEEGIRTAETIDDDPHALGSTLARIAATQVEKNDREGAKKTLDLALNAARRIDADEIWKNAAGDLAVEQTWALLDLLLDIAATRTDAGQKEEARTEFAELLKSTESHAKRTYLRASLLGEIAKVESQSGFSANAAEWSYKLTGAADRASALLGVAEGLLVGSELQIEK
jgi:tetratricopeptide (TPR) repeat protein